jgi:hypothetical protein
LVERYRALGISVSHEEATLLLDRARRLAQQSKRPLGDGELQRLHAQLLVPLAA